MAEAAHVGRAEPMRHGIAYTVGILGSMAVLGTCVVALRAAGHSVGWGFQFQEPIYIAAIATVLVAFALNLFGTYEIRAGAGPLGDLGQQATGARRSFFEGLLAVALATPCSAPFLGTAVGFAFASSPVVILAIFLAVGLGLAAPFALITLVPAWARFVPRSGAWMQAVRAGLGFALLATCVWLLWLFGGAAGTGGMVGLVGFLLALAFALWGFGLLQRSEHHRTALGAGLAVIVFGIAGLNAVRAQIPTTGDTSARKSQSGEWQTWSPAAVRSTLAAGSPVFVRFTADWCITCKVNERVVLDNDGVQDALERGGFVRFVGDWTQRDDAIRTELARHGRAGVPLYLLYHPDRPEEPRLLPELLTIDDTLRALRAASDSGAGNGAG
jgi:thiol:disulfide interchange protein DsbD